MKISEMKVKSWYKVQLIAKTKTIKVTKQEFKTKAEGIEKGVSKGYDILNLKAINKLLCEGWTEYTAKEENSTQPIVEPVKAIEESEQLNPEIEAQIEAYAQAKIERDIKAYEEKKRKQEAIARFLNTPPTQPKQQAFDYDKQWDKYYKTGKPRAERALNAQMSQYKEV